MLHNRSDRNAGFGVVGVIVIVVALLVTGFVGWRVYDANQKPKTSVSANTSTSKENQTKETTDAPLVVESTNDPNEGYVVIEQWGVRFKPAEELGEVQYFKPRGLTLDAFTFTTKTLADTAASCSPSSGNIILGLMYRSTEQRREYGETLAKIGDYYYQYRSPQAMCGTDDGVLEGGALMQLVASVRTLEAAK